MKKRALTMALCLAAAVLTAGLAGAEEETKIIGVEEEGARQYSLTNGTGRDICEIRIRSTEEEEFSDNILEEDDVFEAEETRTFFYVFDTEEEQEFTEEDFAEADAADGEEEDLPDDKLLTIGYDLQITFVDDNSTAEINAFPFDDMEEATIRAEDGVAFLVYTSIETEEEVNTKEYALSILKMAQDAEKAAQEAAAAASQQASTGSSSSYTTPSYTTPSYTAPASEPSYTVPADPAPAEPAPEAPAEPAPEVPAATDTTPAEPAYTDPGYTDPGTGGGDEDNCIVDGLIYD